MSERAYSFGSEIETPEITDISFWSAMMKARAINETLAQLPNPPEDMLEDFEHTLTHLWPNIDTNVVVTGRLQTLSVDESHDVSQEHGGILHGATLPDGRALEDETEYIVEGQLCEAKGFAIIETGEVVVGGEPIGAQYAAQLVLLHEIEITTADKQTVNCKAECFAAIDEVIMQLPDPSYMHMNYLSDQYFPDYLGQLDEVVDADDVALSLMNIKDLSIQVPRYVGIGEREALQHTLNECLNVSNQGEQFVLRVEPGAAWWIAGTDDQLEGACFTSALAIIRHVEVRPKVVRHTLGDGHGSVEQCDGEFEVRVMMSVNADTPRDDIHCSLRLSDITDIQSVRSLRQTLLGDV